MGLPVRIGISGPQNDEAPPIPAELPAIKLKKRQNAFAISVKSVLRKLREKKEIIVVDVRKNDAFEKLIAGVLMGVNIR